jgi:ubiquinone/menaquinone biosynthesis C-methylase UbiE
MQETEFDKFADEYQNIHGSNIRISGEEPKFFAHYKIADVAALVENPELQLNILDFGAGIGTSVPHFRSMLPRARLTCLDVSAKSLDIAKQRYSGQAEFIEFDGKVLPFSDDTFDVVFSACVFHHIPQGEHQALLVDLRRVLKPGGLCVIFEHNPFNPLTVRAVNTCPFDENAILIKAAGFSQHLREAGFSQVTRRYRIFFPGALRMLRFLEAYLTWLPLGAQYYVFGRK